MQKENEKENGNGNGGNAAVAAADDDSDDEATAGLLRRERRSRWYRFTRLVTSHPILILIIFTAVTAAFAVEFAENFHGSTSIRLQESHTGAIYEVKQASVAQYNINFLSFNERSAGSVACPSLASLFKF
jgi:hypothetical protein